MKSFEEYLKEDGDGGGGGAAPAASTSSGLVSSAPASSPSVYGPSSNDPHPDGQGAASHDYLAGSGFAYMGGPRGGFVSYFKPGHEVSVHSRNGKWYHKNHKTGHITRGVGHDQLRSHGHSHFNF